MADRTSAPDLPGLDGPQIATTQPTPLAAPQYQAPSAGFDIMRQGLNSFFGKAAEGLDAVDKAVQYQRREDIKGQFFLQRSQVAKDNKQNAEQAAADALAGKPMNPALAQSFAYADNYQKTAGKQHGYDLMTKFMSDVYPKLGPGDNAATAADAFLKQEYGDGTGNAAYDAAALSTFKQSVDRPILAHIENGTKAVAAQGLQQLQSTIAASIASGQFNAGMVPGIIAQARVLNPMDPASAAPFVAQTIRGIAGSNPAIAQTVLAELDKPGSSGTPGRSYHEMFPDAYAQVENGLTKNVVEGRGLQAANAWSDLNRQRTTATTAEQWTDPDNGLLVKALRNYQQYGGQQHLNTFFSESMPVLKKLAATQVAINSIDQMANGSTPTDNKLIDAHLLTDYFPANHIDPYQNPEAAAGIVAKLNTVPTDLKDNMSTRLLNSNDPSGQKVALRFYDSFKQYYNGDDGMVKPHMSDEAKTVYSLIQDQRATAGNDPGALDNVLARVDQGIAKSREYDKIPWTQITGDTHPADAENRARDSLTKALVGSGPWGLFHTSGAFVGSGESPTMDWVTQRNLLQTLKQSAVLRSQSGKVDLQGTADEVVNNMWQSGRAELLPGEGGTTMFRLKPDNSSPALSPVSINPATGKPENTLSVFRADLGALSGAVPGLIDSPSNISVNPMSPRGMDGKAPQGSEGVYWLSRNGDRLQIGLGSKLNIADQTSSDQIVEPGAQQSPVIPSLKETVVPKDPTEALAFLQKSLPGDRGLVLVPNDPVHPTTFFVGYRPHFLGTAPPAPPAVTPEQMLQKRTEFHQTTEQMLQQRTNDDR